MGLTYCKEPQFLYSTVITLLRLLAVQTLQSISACTVQLYFNNPIGPYKL